MQILDLGLSPTLSRELSLHRAGTLSLATARARLRCLEWVIGTLALLAVLSLTMSSDWIARDWLSFSSLEVGQVRLSIIAMAYAACLRWVMGLYRSGLIGLEKQSAVNAAGFAFATLRFLGVIALLNFWSAAAITFFAYQAIVGLIECLTHAWLLYRYLPSLPGITKPDWSGMRSMLPIAGAMAFMSGMWIFLTQIDKLILSKCLSLQSFGYFTLAAALAGGVLILVPPLNQVLQPRLTILVAAGRVDALRELYRLSTRRVTAVFVAIGGTLALFSEPLVRMWVGSPDAVEAASPILFWYALAYTPIGVLTLPFMLQFGFGYLRLHVVGNLLVAMTLLPTLMYASAHFGGVGAGITLLCGNVLFLFLWVPLAHRRLMPTLVWVWPFRDVLLVALPIIAWLTLVSRILPSFASPIETLLVVALVLGAALLVGFLAGGGRVGDPLGAVRR
ncbi:oligosaccharide flippase family protein [uncultured Thiodictyon sp.]|uniref:lipopolysaccharide biosynthesis protein n=1 Tax=uncultured Thiodictyon sp. TaxID=1846217 RepID=UPI0025F06F8D|nr:oligosaccharide flippase family protein [uncultured Thiodictyon sp.]